MSKEFLWCEKYRPKKLEDVILTENLNQTFKKFVDQKNVPNLILSGGAGVGKTTCARAILEELNCDYIVINGSLKGNIDTLRVEIQNFASTVSLSGGRKYVILDEADYLNPNSTQPALRNFMEEFSKNCGFILTCNFKNRIISPLHSRCATINFDFPSNEKPKLASKLLKRIEYILTNENIEFDRKVLSSLIISHFPDMRKTLNELQRYSVSGKIDSGILCNVKDISLSTLIKTLKDKNFNEMRKWVAQNIDNDINLIFRSIYDASNDFVSSETMPALVVALGEYQDKSSRVADQEINLAACLTEIMYSCEFV